MILPDMHVLELRFLTQMEENKKEGKEQQTKLYCYFTW